MNRDLVIPRGLGGRKLTGTDLIVPKAPDGRIGVIADPTSNGPRLKIPVEIPGKYRFAPICVLFFGRRGKGKTAAMTAFASMQLQRYLAFGAPFKVASNYWMSFSDHADPYLIDELKEFPKWGHHLLICVDEVTSAFPGRRSMAQINILFSNFLTQIRKRQSEVMFTSQFPGQLDVQILMQIDLFIRCELVDGRHVELFVHDHWGQWTGNFQRKPWPPMPGYEDWRLTLLNVDAVFGQYNTDEVIASMSSTQRDAIIGDYWAFTEDDTEEQDAEAKKAPPLPENIEEAIEEWHKTHGAFSLLEFLPIAKKFDPNIKSQTRVKELLIKHGFTVTNYNGLQIAEKGDS